MSPFQVETMLEDFRRIHAAASSSAGSETLDISEDGRQNARSRVRQPKAPEPPGWVGPGQILELIADRTPSDPAVDYEMQRRAARFLASATPPANPLPPFELVRDLGKKVVKRGKTQTPSPELKEMPPAVHKETPLSEPEHDTSVEPVLLEPAELDEELMEPLEVEAEDIEAVEEENEFQEPPQSVSDSGKAEEVTNGNEEEEEYEMEIPRAAGKPEAVTAAQLLDEMEEEEEDFDEDEGLRADETDESDVVFGSGPITQASMMEFMRKYPDSVIKFLLRRNLDGRPLPHEFETIYNQWQERGLMRGRLKRNLLRMMDWEEIPDLPINELVGQIRGRVLDQKLSEE